MVQQIYRNIMSSHTLTHLDISGHEFSSKFIFEIMRAIQYNFSMQELKLSIFESSLKGLPENGKNIKNYNKY